jgi:hypothetical protein
MSTQNWPNELMHCFKNLQHQHTNPAGAIAALQVLNCAIEEAAWSTNPDTLS